MSRIGNSPIQIPSGVTVEVQDGAVNVKGPKGEMSQRLVGNLSIKIEDSTLYVVCNSEDKDTRSLFGLTRTLIDNMVTGVTKGFTKSLEISGVGYRVAQEGNGLILSVGYSHPVRVQPAPGISFVVESPTRLTIQGIDKQQVGEQAAKIRAIREPEPYKGKGIRYSDEVIRRKAGKAGGRK